ncbi:MAG: hypothetical protein EAZ95_05080 [Bacteroidetes bacterium]|nr:MAG: hypothetical protein EAZ95_05080 [Bacteroidota bacterium]
MTIDWNFIDEQLEAENYASVFAEMSKIEGELPHHTGAMYYMLKQTYERNFIDVHFKGRLQTFLQNRELREMFG